jgi:Nucleotidyl transferase AbiEii toxin, Type IV TA system
VSRLRDNEADFEGAIVSAAERLGLAPVFVEKDYWVTQVLRTLHERHAGAFVLKGGTSLSKGYELIERFSEDVDILIQPARDDSAKSRERLLQTITEHVAHTLDIDWLPAREPGRGKTPHRADVLSYPRVVRSAVAIPEDRGQFERVLSEMQVISATHYAGWTERPSDGYASSPAFEPPIDSELRAWLQARYGDAATLMPAKTSGQWPSFGQVLKRISEHSRLL